MKLYTYFRSSAAYRVRIALNLKGLSYESVPVDLRPGAHRQADYLARNPQGLIPALEVLEDAPAVISQSLAIIEYLEEKQPHPPLLPRSPLDRARVRSLALAMACDIHPLNNLRVLNYLRSPLGHDDAAIDAWYRHWIAEGFRGLEEEAKRASGDGRHMFGTDVTLADVCLVPQMFNARRFKCNVEPFPTLVGICANFATVPAFTHAAPEAQPDAS
ncbi:MAG TPA: maleylacetoacetate isomerase [Steroidobacteraceae bacterium]|jgi:maleylacetoacetate isomerase